MKKLIAISISLVLFASAAFAQVTVNGMAFGLWTPFASKDGSDPANSFSWNGRLQVDAATEDNKFGGTVRVHANTSAPSFADNAYAWAWWQPIEQFRFVLGANPDGFYAVNEVVGYQFHLDASDYVATGAYSIQSAFYTGFGGAGASFIITPIEPLAITFVVPSFGSLSKTAVTTDTKTADLGAADTSYAKAEDAWKHFNALATYNIDSVGRIAVAYTGGAGKYTAPTPAAQLLNPYGFGTVDTGKIFASFLLNSIENLAVNFGVRYDLPVDDAGYKYSSPLGIGLGAAYGAGDFGVKAKLDFFFLGSVKQGSGDAAPMPYKFNFEVMPYYDLGILKAFLNLGMNLVTDQENADGDNVAELYMDWYVNPYIVKAVGSGQFFAGFQLNGTHQADGKSGIIARLPSGKVQKWDTILSWSIPVAIQFSF